MAAGATDVTWSVRRWQSDDGLPNNSITGMAQTSDGYLWIASPGPLARFDGDRFEHFTPSRLVAGYHQNARALLAARDGSLWLSMAHGPVFRVKPDNTTEVYTNNLPDMIVQRVLEDRDGGIWLVFPGGQVREIKDGRVGSFTGAEGWNRATATTSMACDGGGVVWFAKGRDIGCFTNGHFALTTEWTNYAAAHVGGSRAGGVWIASAQSLWRYEGTGLPVFIGKFLDKGSEPTEVFEDDEGGVWIGTFGNGLFYYNRASGFQRVEVSHPQVLSIMEDKEGNIWVGTGGGGLDRIRRSVVRMELPDNGLPFEALESICEDTNNVLWAVTQNGMLVRRVDNRWSVVPTNSVWTGESALCVAADRFGRVWIGGRNALYCADNGEWKSWHRGTGLGPARAYALFVDHAGDLWVSGTNPESLQRLQGDQWRTYALPPDANFVRTFAEDANGNIWAGTSKGNLLRVNGDVLVDETTNTFGIRTSIRGMCATDDGSVWIVCAGGGLGWIDRSGHFARITAEQGLVDNYLSQVMADDNGWLWFGSDHGIFKVRQEALKDVAGGRAARVQCVQYGRSEGLSGLQANFGHWPAAARSHDGLFWMPMRTGLAVVDPRAGERDAGLPPVVLKRVIMDGEPMAAYGKILPADAQVDLAQPTASLRLPPAHHRLEFQWTALNFSAPENVNFRYQLEGFDDHWVDAGTDRSAGYSRLPAGNYRFKVQARNGDREWSDSLALPLMVSPFVWQTWWFRGTALLLFTGGIIAIVRYVSFRRLRSRLQALEQQAALDRERARIARDIHDDLGGSLTQVAMLSGLAQKGGSDAAKVGEYVQRISTTTHQVIRSLDEVVWAVNPRNDNLQDTFQYISQFAIQFLSAAGIKCRLELPDRIPQRTVFAENRHNLFLVVKEALNNIVRHAGATEVWLRAKLAGKSFHLTIEDNGRGFKMEPRDAFADGVRNMSQRMQELGGTCEIESVVGKGTCVKLSFPVEG